jgi:hypothetical protein
MLAQPLPPAYFSNTWPDIARLFNYQLDMYPAENTAILTLYWHNLSDQPLPLDMFIHLIDAQGQGLAQLDGQLLGDGHRWRGGQTTISQHVFPLPAELSGGPYFFRLGLFNAQTAERYPLLGNSQENAFVLGLFYPESPPQAASRLAIQFDQQVILQGYTLAQTQPADSLELELVWRKALTAPQPSPINWTSFVQVLDAQGQVVAGADSQPGGTVYPTSYWQAGDVISQNVNIPLPADLPPGDYAVITGLYQLETGQRLPAFQADGQAWPNQAVPILSFSVNEAGLIQP